MLCFRIAVARVCSENVAANSSRRERTRVDTRQRKLHDERGFRQSVAIRDKREARANKSPGPFFHFPGERRGRKIASWKKHAQLGHVAARDSVQFTRKNRGRRHGGERDGESFQMPTEGHGCAGGDRGTTVGTRESRRDSTRMFDASDLLLFVAPG